MPSPAAALVSALFGLVWTILPVPGLAEDDEVDEEDALETLMGQEEKATEDYDKLVNSLFIEAEEMDGVDPATKPEAAWVVNTSPPTYTSRNCCVCRKLGPISRKILIPADEKYLIWVRYRLQAEKRAPFVLKVLKAGKPVFEHKFYAAVAKGGMVKALQKERSLWFDISGMQEGMFSGTEWTWERAAAGLPKGEAELVIEPLQPSYDFAPTLDAVFLTASTAFRPTFDDFHEVWVRYRPLAVEPENAEFTIDVGVQWLRLVILRGKEMIGTGAGTLIGEDGQPLRAGRKSVWLELYDELKYGAGYCTTTFGLPYGAKPLSKVVVELDIAWGPREGQILKTVKETADLGAVFGLTMPTDAARKREDVVASVWPPSFTGTFRTFTDLSRERHERVKRLVPEPVKPSKYFNFCTGVTPPGGTYASSEIMKTELLTVSQLGINSLYAAGQNWPRRLGLGHLFVDRYYTAGASPALYWIRRACPNHPDASILADETMKRGAEDFVKATEDPEAGKRVFGLKIGDEIGVAVGQPHMDTCEDCQHRFQEFLQAEGLDPARFGRRWSDVRWTPLDRAGDEFRRLLYYYSVLFLSTNTAGVHAKLVAGGQKYYAETIPIGYNVNPTPIMGGMGLDWFEMERHKGISAQWMEVIGSIQPGGASFLADLTWGIVNRRKLGMGIYCLYVGEQTGRDILAFAVRGCKSFILYNYGPRTLGAADNFSESDYAIESVAKATRPIVAAEEFLHNAKRPARQAAFIYSRAAEIWGEDNAVSHNRAYTYVALDHAQIPMDVLSEWDVLDGRLSGYRVAYLAGTHLRRDVAQRVKTWVEAGGHLWGDVGAAMRDEADSRMDVLEAVFGAKQRVVERKFPVEFSYYLAVTPDSELQKVAWEPGPWGKGGETECVVQRAIVEPAGGKVVAKFDDGLPAALVNAFGKGRATLLAYPAGLVYSRFYRDPKRTTPFRFDALDRDVIVQAALDAGVQRPVTLSKPGIEVNRLDSEKGTAIAFIDMWLQKPEVRAELPFDRKPQKVRSVKSGDLAFEHKDGKLAFSVQFELLDIVTIE
jgi:hypothetical protein